MNIRVKSVSNCPSGEYPAVFCSSTIEKYPKGKRQILSFLIFNQDGFPKQNNLGDNYYAVAVCNPSSGANPKSKVHKVLKCLLTKDEYNPVISAMSLPDIETLLPNNEIFPRIVNVKVKIVGDNKKASVITHIQRLRDNIWECVEGEYDGSINKIKNKTKNPIELFNNLKKNIKNKEYLEYAEEDMRIVFNKDNPFIDPDGNFIKDVNVDSIKNTFQRNYYERILKFIETENLKDLFTFIK